MVEGAPSERPKAVGSSKAHMKKGFPGNRVCKKTVRETCDVRKHTMKCRFPGILCVKNNTRGGAGQLLDAIRGERGVVFILSNGRGGPSAAGAEARAPPRNGRKQSDCQKHI